MSSSGLRRRARRSGPASTPARSSRAPTSGQRLATGDAVNAAARLEQNAPANEVLIGELTYALVRDHVEAERSSARAQGQGRAGPRLPAARGRRRRRAATARTRRSSAASSRWRSWRGARPGVRHTSAPARDGHRRRRGRQVPADRTTSSSEHDADAVMLRGRCLAYGDGDHVLADRGGRPRSRRRSPRTTRRRPPRQDPRALIPTTPERDQIVGRVAAAIGLAAAQFPVAELFWGDPRLLESLAADQPLIVLSRRHPRAAPTFLEFLDHLVESSKRVPIVLVCSARHELLERAPGLGRPARERRRSSSSR